MNTKTLDLENAGKLDAYWRVVNELGRFHLVMDAIDRLPQTGEKGVYLKQQLKDKLVEHKEYIGKNGRDLPEIRDRKWGSPK